MATLLPTTHAAPINNASQKRDNSSSGCMMVHAVKFAFYLMLVCGSLSAATMTVLYFLENFIDTECELNNECEINGKVGSHNGGMTWLCVKRHDCIGVIFVSFLFVFVFVSSYALVLRLTLRQKACIQACF